MSANIQGYPSASRARSSRLTVIVTRLPLLMMTAIFTLISIRYLAMPVQAAAAVGISFTSPGGITVARVGFAGFPLAFAILAFTSLTSKRRLIAGLYMVLTLSIVVIAVRIFGIVLDHSTESAHLLIPEAVLLILSLVGIQLERRTRQQETI
jgi:hypothetical protein